MAQEPQTKGEWEVSGTFEWRIWNEPDGGIGSFAHLPNVTPKSCYLVQPSVGIPLGRGFALRVDLRYFRLHEEAPYLPEHGEPGGVDYWTLSIYELGVGLEYAQEVTTWLQPYIGLGVGVGLTASTEEAVHDLFAPWKSGGNWREESLPVVGAGVRVFVQRNLVVHVHLQYEYGGPDGEGSGWVNNHMFRQSLFLGTGVGVYL